MTPLCRQSLSVAQLSHLNCLHPAILLCPDSLAHAFELEIMPFYAVIRPCPDLSAATRVWGSCSGVPRCTHGSTLPGIANLPGLRSVGPVAPMLVPALLPPAGPTLAGQPLLGVMHPLAIQVAPVPRALLQPFFMTGLASMHAVQVQGHATSTFARMPRALQELDLWLQYCGGGRDLMTCTPDQVLMYIEQHWAGVHRNA